MKVGDMVTVYRKTKDWESWFLPDYSEFEGKTFFIQIVSRDRKAILINDWFVPKSCLKYVKD